jgi:16S rRNA (cytosine1402-N4)-methyltransferase
MHIPVLLNEVIKNLNPQPNENFIDATVGEAGHTMCLLQKTSPSGRVMGIDLDSESLKMANEKLKAFLDRVVLVQGNFKNLENIIEEQKFKNIKGILFDLGINSRQIDDSGRGFTFRKDEPLLMNFGRDVVLTAEEIVNNWSEKDLSEMIKNYGEERYALQIAKAIVKARMEKPIKTTFDLINVIKNAVPGSYERGRIHPATRTFQAIRITVNDELNNLKKGLESALKALDSGGRMAVISFHSLEDRIVKNFFRDNKEQLNIITKKPIIPIDVEVLNNPRSRSAKLRVVQKI